MLKSKIILLSVFFAFLGSSLTAQKYVNAYYISLKGDTIKGTALLNAHTQMSKEIRFKAKNGENIVLKPETTKAVWLTPDRFFESQTIHFRNIVDELDGVYFLRYLTKTDSLTLFKFEYDRHEGLYIQKKGEKITALQGLNDFLSQRTDDLRKKEVYITDTIAYAEQMYTFGSVGQYRKRKPYLFWLYKYFDYCDAKIMNSTYILTEKDIKKAFQEAAKCSGKQNQIKNYFKESSWKLSFGITASSQVGSKDFNYVSPFGAGFFIGYSDLRDGVNLGINWLSEKPKATALSPSNGSFQESFLTYNRKVFLREKYNFGTILGVALLKGSGLSAQGRIQGTNYIFEVNPKEESFYSIVGVSGAYQFANNNYLGIQLLRNIHNIIELGTYFDRFQLQYEYRF
jgi:hypothetical protein